jgi:hypothetical protein
MRRLGTIALFVACSVAALAQTRPCTQRESRRADEAVDTLNSWDRIHDWYMKYRQCDDGGPAEGVSEAVARNLVDRWQTLPRLGEFARDPGFRRFVLKHLDETLNADDLRKIAANAKERCPATFRSLCQELKVQAEAQ